ncbi:hypothetical protein TcWFU_010434 [Taenia crassiceps]|uniref:Uncharacterized protein n=1 Tax=Taenia crassiceps TaxID=6207 RepID=A0ABR4QN10_9CEST
MVLEGFGDVKLFLEVGDGNYKFTVEHGHVVKLFAVEPDLTMSDFPLVGACDNDGKWRHLGIINSRLRVAANSDSFDQLRANVIKAMESSRKTSFPAWKVKSPKEKPDQRTTRQVVTPIQRADTSSSKTELSSAEVSVAEKAREQYRRILEVVELARKRRVDLEERLASLHRDKSLSEAQMRTAVATIEEETCSLLKELLGNEDLSATIPPCSGDDNSLRPCVSFSEFLRQLIIVDSLRSITSPAEFNCLGAQCDQNFYPVKVQASQHTRSVIFGTVHIAGNGGVYWWISLLARQNMGWKMESLRLGLYLSVPLIAFTMSNWPSIVDYYHNAYRLDVYEKTGVDILPHDIDSIETIQQNADKRPWFLNLHRIRRPDGPPRHRTSE